MIKIIHEHNNEYRSLTLEEEDDAKSSALKREGKEKEMILIKIKMRL